MEQVIIGKIVNTHGIKGELKVNVSTDFIEESSAFRNQFLYMCALFPHVQNNPIRKYIEQDHA